VQHVQGLTVAGELGMVMPVGKVAVERDDRIGVNRVDEGVSGAHEFVRAIHFGEHQVVRRIDVHVVRAAARLHVVHTHAGNITQRRIEPSGNCELRCVQGGDLLP